MTEQYFVRLDIPFLLEVNPEPEKVRKNIAQHWVPVNEHALEVFRFLADIEPEARVALLVDAFMDAAKKHADTSEPTP